MGYTIKQVRSSILNKWDWNDYKKNIPILVWGPPGVGKTWLIMSIIAERKIKELELKLSQSNLSSLDKEKLTNDLNRLKSYTDPDEIEDILAPHILVMRLAERPIEQIEGVPSPNFECGFTRFLMPENLIYLRKSDWVVVFLDELDKASPSKMAAVTHLIENLRVGDFSLPKDTFLVAAANRTQDSFLSKPVSPELCNRMAHIELEADISSWIEWAAKHNVSKDIIAFHKFNMMRNENYLVRYNYEDNEASSPRAFSTPRSWYNGDMLRTKIYQNYGCKYGVDEKVDEEAVFELEQLVGESSAIEFVTYLKLYSKIDIKKILNGEQKIPKMTDEVQFAEASKDKVDRKEKKEKKKDKRDSVMSEQYICAFALIEQLNEELLAPKGAMKHLVANIGLMLPEIRSVFIQTMHTSNKKLFKKIANHPDAASIVDELISYLADT